MKQMSEILAEGKGAASQARPVEPAEPASVVVSPEEWAAHVAAVKAARGRFAWVRTSSEEFTRRKREEVDREDLPCDDGIE